jgi:hypothetical protein
VAQIAVPADLAAFLQARIACYPAEAPEVLQWATPFVSEFAALPLYFGWTETIALRPDGRLVCWSTEAEYAGMRALEDRDWVLPALVAGADRYPELRALLPERPPGAVDCPCLEHPLLASRQILCGRCGGLGWLATEGRA